jgi:hypothetical protein
MTSDALLSVASGWLLQVIGPKAIGSNVTKYKARHARDGIVKTGILRPVMPRSKPQGLGLIGIDVGIFWAKMGLIHETFGINF